MDHAILVEGVGKRYQLTQATAGYRTLREALVDLAKAPLRRLRSGSGEAPTKEFWALQNVDVTIRQGEVVGVVGRNGAGKSTFLKLLARVTKPTTGHIRLNGRVGSLLEVGTGFHPELTGRENIFLNGAILGLSRREITQRFDEIVEFAEVTQFLDTPVKRYSSGMYVRLAFAVAAHLEPEILLVDEVLAVGDSAFQRKCLGKMGEVARGGRTILFVSHNMAAVTRLCQRALWFDTGQLRDDGDPESIVARYLAAGAGTGGEVCFPNEQRREAPGSEYVTLEAIRVRGGDGSLQPTVDVRYPFSIEVQYRVLRRTSGLRIGIRLAAHDGTVLLSTTDADDDEERIREPGVFVSRCETPGEFLNYGLYYVTVGCDFPMQQTHFLVEHGLAFQIAPTGGAGGHISDGRTGVLRLRLPWTVEPVGEPVHR